jgi:hypothetical protein
MADQWQFHSTGVVAQRKLCHITYLRSIAATFLREPLVALFLALPPPPATRDAPDSSSFILFLFFCFYLMELVLI